MGTEVFVVQNSNAWSSEGWIVTRRRSTGILNPSVTSSHARGIAFSLKYAPVGVKLPSISKNVP